MKFDTWTLKRRFYNLTFSEDIEIGIRRPPSFPSEGSTRDLLVTYPPRPRFADDSREFVITDSEFIITDSEFIITDSEFVITDSEFIISDRQ